MPETGRIPNKIIVELSKSRYSSDEVIEGKIILELDKEVKARRIRIVFRGETGVGRTRNTIHQEIQNLDNSSSYGPGKKEYGFGFAIPQLYTKERGFFEKIEEAIFGDMYERISWSLDASLDKADRLDENTIEKIRIKRAQNK